MVPKDLRISVPPSGLGLQNQYYAELSLLGKERGKGKYENLMQCTCSPTLIVVESLKTTIRQLDFLLIVV